jgi:hypothetical protein
VEEIMKLVKKVDVGPPCESKDLKDGLWTKNV